MPNNEPPIPVRAIHGRQLKRVACGRCNAAYMKANISADAAGSRGWRCLNARGVAPAEPTCRFR